MASRGSRPALLRQMFGALNFKGTVGKNEVTIHHPGLSFGDFHLRTPATWRLMKLMEGARFYAFNAMTVNGESGFLEYDVLTSDRMTFMGSTEFIIDRRLYDRTVVKSPLDVKVSLYHIGKSSLSTQGKVFVPESEHPLVSNINQVVSIDRSTRRPMALPDWWKNKYAEMAASDQPMIVQSESKPDDAVVHEASVAWSDTDFYEHTNWTSYVKFCVDVANTSALKGQLKHVSKETVRTNAVNTLRVRYSGESILGDTLQIYLWEPPDEENTIKFQVYKDTIPICFVLLKYYSVSECDAL